VASFVSIEFAYFNVPCVGSVRNVFAWMIRIQGTIDWSSVAASGLSFAMAKATEGTGYVDPMFYTNFEGMQVKKSPRVAGADNGK
jgi:hypothetical protein